MLLPDAHAELGRRYGVRKRSAGRYFVNPAPNLWYLAMNHDRPLFGGPTSLGNVKLKQAVNYAIDRIAMIEQFGAYAGAINDQYMPPTMPGFQRSALPLAAEPGEGARARARAHAKRERRPVLRDHVARSREICRVAQANLRATGLDLEIHIFRGAVLDAKIGTRGEPFDLALRGFVADYFDPSLGEARYRAFAELDLDLARNAAPHAAIATTNDRFFFPESTGCFFYHPLYGLDLAAICKR